MHLLTRVIICKSSRSYACSLKTLFTAWINQEPSPLFRHEKYPITNQTTLLQQLLTLYIKSSSVTRELEIYYFAWRWVIIFSNLERLNTRTESLLPQESCASLGQHQMEQHLQCPNQRLQHPSRTSSHDTPTHPRHEAHSIAKRQHGVSSNLDKEQLWFSCQGRAFISFEGLYEAVEGHASVCSVHVTVGAVTENDADEAVRIAVVFFCD